MLLVQILGGIFGLIIAYVIDYFVVERPLKKEEIKIQKEILEVRLKMLNKNAGTK
jgi:hypothetical protein